jgi:hypothetical protein
MTNPFTAQFSRVSWIDDLLYAKVIGGADGIHQSFVLVLKLCVSFISLLLTMLTLDLPKFERMTDFNAAFKWQ